jgi:hypothetical protein
MQSIHKKKQRRRFAVERLKSEDVATQYRNELKSEFQSAHDDQTRSLNELWYETEEKKRNIAASTVGYVQKQEEMSGLTRKRTAQERRRSNFKTEPDLQSSLHLINTGKHEEGNSICLER